MENVAMMRTFALVVNSGSFSAAARQMGVAPSSVSRQINELEAALGINLFHRTTRKLSLTEAGHIYYERVGRIIDEVEDARLALSELSSPSGVLRVTIPTGVGRELVISAMPAFLEKYPGIRVIVSMTDSLIDIVEAGYDVGIRIGKLRDSSIKARQIGKTRRIVCGSPAYLAKAGVPRQPEELTHHNCITFRDQPGFNIWRFQSENGSSEVKVSGNFSARSADALVSAAIADLGLVLLPEHNLLSELTQKRLQRVLHEFDALPKESTIWAVHSHQRHVPPKIRVFIDFLVSHFDQPRDY